MTSAAPPPVAVPAPLEGPFRTAPAADTLEPTQATVNLVRSQVQALLAATPSYHELPADDQKALADRMVYIGSYAAECMREVCWQSQQLGQIPVVRKKRSIETPVASAQASNFKPEAANQIARITEQTLKAVAFPTFVADLIRGTFDAIVKTSIQQMESFIELVSNATKTVDQFMSDNISDFQARDWLAQRYREHIEVKEGQAVVRDGADEKPAPDFRRDLNLPENISLDDSAIEEKLVPAARRRLAESRLQLLSTLVLMGVNRIIVTGGKIRATMGFHIDTSDRAREEHASDFDFRTAAAGSFGYGPWSASASMSLSYVTSTRASSDSEINVDTDLTGEVELHFKSDYFPVQRFAAGAQIGAIRNNTAVPEANAPEGTANPLGSGVPAAGGEVGAYKSARTRRSPAPEPTLRKIGEPLPEAKMPEKPMPADTFKPDVKRVEPEEPPEKAEAEQPDQDAKKEPPEKAKTGQPDKDPKKAEPSRKDAAKKAEPPKKDGQKKPEPAKKGAPKKEEPEKPEPKEESPKQESPEPEAEVSAEALEWSPVS